MVNNNHIDVLQQESTSWPYDILQVLIDLQLHLKNMVKSKPTLDIYSEICIRQIAYLYCLWASLDNTEDRFYTAKELVDNFGHLIDGVDISQNLLL